MGKMAVSSRAVLGFMEQTISYYAKKGMCHLAIARCEQSIGNTQGEAEALISASRCYLLAEEATIDLGSPSYEENLTSCIQTYNHAIRLLIEKGTVYILEQ